MYLHLLIQKVPLCKGCRWIEQSVGLFVLPSGMHRTPSWKADRKLQTTYLLLQYPQYCIAPAPPSSCGQMIASGQETGKACRESQGRASRTFSRSIYRPTAIYRAYMQSWFLHRNMVTSRCILQETHTENFQICIEEQTSEPHLFQKSIKERKSQYVS